MTKLPDRMHFEGIGHRRCLGQPRWGRPRAGEFFASGAVVAAYRATHDMDTSYWIVLPARPPYSGLHVRGCAVTGNTTTDVSGAVIDPEFDDTVGA